MDYYIKHEDRMQAVREALDAGKNGFFRKDGRIIPFPAGDYMSCTYITDAAGAVLPDMSGAVPVYQVAPMDSFEALVLAENPERTAVMNFACATAPGGGFLTGHKAQEEVLCLQSTLYASLTSLDAAPYYETNTHCTQKLRPVSMLHSPRVWVFRQPDLTIVDPPIPTQVVTIAAPNLKGSAKGVNAEELRAYFEDSIRMMCRYLAGRADTLILGAWGCGAFGNKPRMVADCFRNVLVKEGWERAFRQIIFAVRNANSENYGVFSGKFSGTAMEAVRRETKTSTGREKMVVNKDFAKSASAYVIEKTGYMESQGSYHSYWNKTPVTVRSSGRKYVTVTGCGAPRKFVTSDRPVLLSEKGCAYLVGTDEHADKLIERLSNPVSSAAL